MKVQIDWLLLTKQDAKILLVIEKRIIQHD